VGSGPDQNTPGDRQQRLRLVRNADNQADQFSLLGISVSALRFDAAVQLLLDAPRGGHRLRVHFAGLRSFLDAWRDVGLREALAGADLVAPVNRGLVWLGRLRGKQPEQLGGRSVMLAVVDKARAYGYRHFFYGGTPQRLEELVADLTQRFPGVEIAGTYAPPSRPLSFTEVDDVVHMLNEAHSDYLWVGLGSPRQDYWLAAFQPLLHAPVLLAVGRSFGLDERLSGRVSRWARSLSRERLWQLIRWPGRQAKSQTAFGLGLVRPRETAR
jgi:N-acetylglucosaminyldiphosphoundecaprenol N-acetyl-beta-D-mannosaminyltransferase